MRRGGTAWATVAAVAGALALAGPVGGARPLPDTSLPPPQPVRWFTLAVTGDTLMHSPIVRQAERHAAVAGATGFDFAPMLAELGPMIAPADLAVCHLETPVAPPGEALSTAPIYGVPAEVVPALAAAGYDRCSTASNHTMDRGAAGIDATLAAFDAAGLGQSGMARTPVEIEPRVVTVRGIAVSHLSYTFSYNGLRAPSGEDWRSALIDPARIIADARAARAAGAEVVLVSLHWGVEGVAAVTPAQRALAEQLTADGSIDVIIGHHAHVLQPIEAIHDRWVLFGLGNAISNLPTSDRWPAASQDGAVVVLRIAVRPGGGVSVAAPVVHPTWVDRDAGWVVRDVQAGLADPATPPGRRDALTRSLARTTSVLGAFVAG